MTHFVIALSADHPDAPPAPDLCYWCGYVSMGKTHQWIKGRVGAALAVRFLEHNDALRAGVSGPNVPHPGLRPQPQFWLNRGVQIIRRPLSSGIAERSGEDDKKETLPEGQVTY